MAKITFEEPDGKLHTVDMAGGQSVMEGAVKAMVAGIDADCGGACSCATCMVYVAAEWEGSCRPSSRTKSKCWSSARTCSRTRRLTCQIPVTDALDGLTVKIPPSQH